MGFGVADVLPVPAPDRGDEGYLGQVVSILKGMLDRSAERTSRYSSVVEPALAAMESTAVTAVKHNADQYLVGYNKELASETSHAVQALTTYRSARDRLTGDTQKIRAATAGHMRMLNRQNTRLETLCHGQWHAHRWDSGNPSHLPHTHGNPHPSSGDVDEFHSLTRKRADTISDLAVQKKRWQTLQHHRSDIDHTITNALNSLTFKSMYSSGTTAVPGLPAMGAYVPTFPSVFDPSSSDDSDVNKLADYLQHATPEQVRFAWTHLITPDQQQTLINTQSIIVGNTNGIPLDVAVKANAITAGREAVKTQADIDKIEAQIDALDGKRGASVLYDQEAAMAARAATIARLKAELPGMKDKLTYLKEVHSGARHLARYDPKHDSIIEALGDYTKPTKNVIDYVPGTGASMDDFYNGHAQSFSDRMRKMLSGNTVAFVEKPGPWAAWVGVHSNASPQAMGNMGAKVAGFHNNAIMLEPNLKTATKTIIGHSAGHTIATSAEKDGAKYDHHISLSGSYDEPGWKPNKHTTYDHFQYHNDAINILDDAPELLNEMEAASVGAPTFQNNGGTQSAERAAWTI